MIDCGNHRRVIHDLSQQLRRFEQTCRLPGNARGVVSTGVAPLDELLPERGVPPGTIVEWLGDGPGNGATTLAVQTAANVLRDHGACVILDERRELYPPGLGPLLGMLERVIVVRPADAGDALWALEQSLRCSGAAVVLGWIERVEEHAYRRLQLAAEAGGGIGLLLRPAEYRSQPSWAGVRLLVQPLPGQPPSNGVFAGRRLRVELVHCRGRIQGGGVDVVSGEW